MKILYAIQGTGNGHLSRANDIVPLLKKKVETDVLVSGIQADVESPFQIDFRYNGLSFIFGKKGGVDIWDTLRRSDLPKLWREIVNFPVTDYDLVINDFEPVSSWAASLKNVPCISLSHQAAVLSENAPKPRSTDWIGAATLKYYAPVNFKYGFHFKRYNENVFTPVIRQQIRDLARSDHGHYSVYLPAYGDETLIRSLSRFPNVRWEVFSKHTKGSYEKDNVFIKPIENEAFIKSMASSEGVLCGAGFETPAEALFLGKKLAVLPMKTQYEQQCNAAALEEMSVPVFRDLSEINLPLIGKWIESDERIVVNYEDHTEEVVDIVLNRHFFSRSAGGMKTA